MNPQSALSPAGPEAGSISHLFYFMLAVAVVVYILVVGALLLIIRRRRESDDDPRSPEREAVAARRIRLAVAVTVPVMFVLLAYDFAVGRGIGAMPTAPMLTVTVTGHRWWWQVDYEDPVPQNRVRTANEIHIPAGRPVRVKLLSHDVIHSFWVPNLQGKRDLIPGYTTTHWIKADKPGTYRGQCAEFCGLQHAKMALHVVAESPAQFRAWFAQASTPNSPPSDSTSLYGQRVFLTAGCSVCHTIGGTTAQATIGPSLTHFKSRATIAAGTLANTRENVEGWIANPQAIKPGTRMPAVPLKPAELTALVSYLETLK